MMTDFTASATFDMTTGLLIEVRRVAAVPLPEDVMAGQCVVVPSDGRLPSRLVKLDRRKARSPVIHVTSLDDVLLGWTEPALPSHLRMQIAQMEAIDRLDQDFAARLASAFGPLAFIHAEKRIQAEAGSGPLIANEAERIAILANAAAQDEAVAAIERERRQAKAAIRAATSEEEIEAALAASSPTKELLA